MEHSVELSVEHSVDEKVEMEEEVEEVEAEALGCAAEVVMVEEVTDLAAPAEVVGVALGRVVAGAWALAGRSPPSRAVGSLDKRSSLCSSRGHSAAPNPNDTMMHSLGCCQMGLPPAEGRLQKAPLASLVEWAWIVRRDVRVRQWRRDAM